MPIINGWDVAEILRNNGYKGRIFGCTGNSMESDIKAFLSAGANRVFIKPVDVSDMLLCLLKDIETPGTD